MSYVHLHCHSTFSRLDGANRIDRLAKHVARQGMNAIALTDHGNMAGMPDLFQACKSEGIKPIAGIEAYVAPGSRLVRERTGGHSGKEHSFHLTLLAKTGEGVRNLYRLSSKSFLEGYYYKPRIDRKILEQHKEGLIVLSGCVSSEYSDHLLADDFRKADGYVAWAVATFGNDFYIEIQNNGVQIQKDQMKRAVDHARRKGIPLVATSDAHYMEQADSDMHDVMLCMSTGARRDDPARMKFDTNEFYVKNAQQMALAFPDHAEALRQTQLIADQVEDGYSSLNFGKRQFPSFKTPDLSPVDQYLREQCLQGLIDRYGVPDAVVTARLDHELAIISRMGFSSYFLILWDIVRYARSIGIPCSARGSACGSITAYSLHLSRVCPIRYGLLFERFLDPSRSEAPDIDIDVCQRRRDEVYQYIVDKYGYDNVAKIGTYGTLAARACIQSVARVFGMPLNDAKMVSKHIPVTLHVTIAQAIEQSADLQKMIADSPAVKQVIDYAQQIEGIEKSAGTHAAGVVICDQPLSNYCPLHTTSVKEDGKKSKGHDIVSTQWTMGSVEAAGLLKLDMLGLRNLTVMQDTIDLIHARGGTFDLATMPMDDLATFQLMQSGHTKGVFQLESGGMRDLLVQMQPDVIDHVIAIVALYRPGPRDGGVVDDYVERRHGRQPIERISDLIDGKLAESYGLMIYQEDIMQVLHGLGDIPLTEAYKVIKAISKKKLDVIASTREKFVAGAVAKGIPLVRAGAFYDNIEKFCLYGFNKCLSVDTKVVNADTGMAWSIQDIPGDGSFYTHSIDDNHKIVKGRVVAVHDNGIRDIFEVKTVLGRTIRSTDTHRFMHGRGGWACLSEFEPGNVIATPSHQPIGKIKSTADDSWDIIWDEIASIEPVGQAQTYDLEMEGNHNFVANGIVVHNSHAAAYADIAYSTAYLKCHYPLEFMASLLSSEQDDTEKLVEHIDDCRRMGITVLPPDVNQSQIGYTIEGQAIRMGLLTLKGLGESSAISLVKHRTTPYRDIASVFATIPPGELKATGSQALIDSGSMDCFGVKRSQLHQVLGQAVKSGKTAAKDRMIGQTSLLDLLDDEVEVAYPDIPEFPERERLTREKEVLGLYMTGHPLAEYRDILSSLSTAITTDLDTYPHKTQVMLGGMISNVTVKHFQKGGSMVPFCPMRFEDMHGEVPAIAWTESYLENRKHFTEDAIGFAIGTVDAKREPVQLSIDHWIPVADAGLAARCVLLECSRATFDPKWLAGLVASHPGQQNVYVEFMDETPRVIYQWSEKAALTGPFMTELSVSAKNRLIGARSQSTGPKPVVKSWVDLEVDPAVDE